MPNGKLTKEKWNVVAASVFSVKMNSTKCGAEAADSKDTEDKIHQWI